jgi:hypothetical protein
MQKKTPRRTSAECEGKLIPLYHMTTPAVIIIFKYRFPELSPWALIIVSSKPV